jgi:molybdenum cofactor cytidylyltransferase
VDSAPEGQLTRVPVDKPLPRDIDTWDDYETACTMFNFPVIDQAHSQR